MTERALEWLDRARRAQAILDRNPRSFYRDFLTSVIRAAAQALAEENEGRLASGLLLTLQIERDC